MRSWVLGFATVVVAYGAAYCWVKGGDAYVAGRIPLTLAAIMLLAATPPRVR